MATMQRDLDGDGGEECPMFARLILETFCYTREEASERASPQMMSGDSEGGGNEVVCRLRASNELRKALEFN